MADLLEFGARSCATTPTPRRHAGRLPARRIAESLELDIATSRGIMLRKGERYLPGSRHMGAV